MHRLFVFVSSPRPIGARPWQRQFKVHKVVYRGEGSDAHRETPARARERAPKARMEKKTKKEGDDSHITQNESI